MGFLFGKSKDRNRKNRSMARRPRGDEKIYMHKKRHGYFPQQFTWRGRRYDVCAVERSWSVSRKRLGNKVERHCFRVRCAATNGRNGGSRSNRAVLEGIFDLYQDLRTDKWHLEKVVSRR
jgi:hypothetical protein